MSEVAAKGCQDTNNDKNEKEDHKLTGQRQKKLQKIYGYLPIGVYFIMYVFMCSSVAWTASSSYSSFEFIYVMWGARNFGSG